MISLKIKKYRPYADVTMVVNAEDSATALPGLEIHLGMLDESQLYSLYIAVSVIADQLESIGREFSTTLPSEDTQF